MKKKYMISFFSLLFLLIITISIFIILVNREKRHPEEEDHSQVITTAPTNAVTPTVTPEPTEVPEGTQLYPAFEIIDGVRKYGYLNSEGEFVIKPAFESASDYHDGVAVVTLSGNYLVIDTLGSIIYTDNDPIEDFCNGAAVIVDRGTDSYLYGYIDTKGNIIVKPMYKQASSFREDNTAYVKTGTGEYALIDKTGKVLENYTVDKAYDSDLAPEDGYLIYSTKKKKLGVVNMKGEEILPAEFQEINYLGDGFFAAGKPGKYSGVPVKLAIFDDKGNQLCDFNYYDVQKFKDGYASATDDKTTFFIATDGYKTANLPDFEGIGTLNLSGNIIQADIDDQLIYLTTNKSIIWQEDDSYYLSNDITVNTMKYRPYRFALVKYPQVDGIADEAIQKQINQLLKSIFVDGRKDLTLSSKLQVSDSFQATLIRNLLIIERDGDECQFGSSQSLPTMEFYYFDISTGIQYQFQDLFLENSDYVAKINEMITEEITAGSSGASSKYAHYSFQSIPETPQFKLDTSGITIYFPINEIAPYSEGFPEFIIPFTDIYDYINRKGAFWNSFQ